MHNLDETIQNAKVIKVGLVVRNRMPNAWLTKTTCDILWHSFQADRMDASTFSCGGWCRGRVPQQHKANRVHARTVWIDSKLLPSGRQSSLMLLCPTKLCTKEGSIHWPWMDTCFRAWWWNSVVVLWFSCCQAVGSNLAKWKHVCMRTRWSD